MHRVLAITILALIPAGAPAATVKIANIADLPRVVAAAKPGDEFVIAAGEHDGGIHLISVAGSKDKPITIRGETAPALSPAAQIRPRTRIKGGSFNLQISKSQHLILSDLELTSARDNGLNIDDGGIIEKPTHHITLRNLFVRDIAGKGNRDGIKLSGVDDLLIENCTVENWGSGGSAVDMVGCHNGLVVNCTFNSKPGLGASGVQTKGGSANITIRQCRFTNAGERPTNIGGSTGDAFFRPALTSKPNAYEAKNITVEGCTFLGGEAPINFVGVDGAVVRFNTLYMPNRWAIRILQEKNEPEFIHCRNGIFEDNLIVFDSRKWSSGGVNIGPDTAPESFKFARNFWYCQDAANRSERLLKLPTKEVAPAFGQDPQFVSPESGDFSLKPASPAKSRGATAFVPPKATP